MSTRRVAKIVGQVNRKLLKLVAYLGLYAEIFSSTCCWVASKRPVGWRMFVARRLRRTKFINAASPTRFQWMQRERIQTCLKTNARAVKGTLRIK